MFTLHKFWSASLRKVWGPAQWEASAAARKRNAAMHEHKADKHTAKAQKATDPRKRALHMMAARSHLAAAQAYRNNSIESARLHAAVAHNMMHEGGKGSFRSLASYKRAPDSTPDKDNPLLGLNGHATDEQDRELERIGQRVRAKK